MNCYHIHGGRSLNGRIKIQGSKNATLPILASAVLIEGTTILSNVPDISDVRKTLDILVSLGIEYEFQNNELIIRTEKIELRKEPIEEFSSLRSSVLFLGSMLGKFNEAAIKRPGGCNIGNRPIDLHIKLLSEMGADILTRDNIMYASAKRIEGKEIILPFKSVGVTQNIILAGVCAKGITVIHNASVEPEVITLIDFLNESGAQIRCIRDVIYITGVHGLYGCRFCIPGDRIVAGTYFAAVAGTGGKIIADNVKENELHSVLEKLREMNCKVWYDDNCISVSRNYADEIKAVNLTTGPFPLFPTDLQPAFGTVLTLASGTSVINEQIFSSRFQYARELSKAGASIDFIEDKSIVIHASVLEDGAIFTGHDLRGSAALFIAGIISKGEFFVYDDGYITRGYEDICRDISSLGGECTKYEHQKIQ